MKPVRFTDLERYRVPYVHSSRTNIRVTFARIQREQQRAAVVEGWPMPTLPEWTPVARSWTDCVRVD